NFGVVGRTFNTVVPREVVGMTVAVILPVGLVVLVVVRDEVVQGVAVVRGDEIHACPGFAPALVEEVGRAGDAAREIRHLAFIAFPERAHGVAVLVVPLGPSR